MFPININTNYRYKNVIKNKKAIEAPTGLQRKEKTKKTAHYRKKENMEE